MNRDFKFRVWDKIDKCFLILNNASLYNFYIGSSQIEMWWDGSEIDLKDYVIQQFTGLKDMEGKDIYEGDIVKFIIDGTIFKSEVVYKYGYFGLSIDKNKRPELLFPYSEACDYYQLMIVRNIFEP